MRRITLRISAALLGLGALALGPAAYAHVHVDSDDASQGAEVAHLVFQVPTESETASTTKVTVKLPAATPFASVSPQSKPGWAITLGKTKHDQAVKVGGFTLTTTISSVTWTATGKGVAPGEYDTFAVALGPVPKISSLSFEADQTYSDGTVVKWDQVQRGSTEPEHPAPTLALTAATSDDAASSTTSTHASSTSNGDDSTARWLGGIAVVLAAAGLVVAVRNNRARA